MTGSIRKLCFDFSSDSEEEFAQLLRNLTVSGKKKNGIKSRLKLGPSLKFDLDDDDVSSSPSGNILTAHVNRNIYQNTGKILVPDSENIKVPAKPESTLQNCNIDKDTLPTICNFVPDEENFITPVKPSKQLKLASQLPSGESTKKYATPTHRWMDIATVPPQAQIDLHAQFLESLSTARPSATPTSQRFVSRFPGNRDELSTYLYKVFNQTVFSDQLPKDMPIVWNSRLTSCAGRCFSKMDKTTNTRLARIELSTKVIGNAGQTRDTMIHEMCHAATWIINEVNESHGYYWKYWAMRTMKMFPSIPPITRCHNYK